MITASIPRATHTDRICIMRAKRIANPLYVPPARTIQRIEIIGRAASDFLSVLEHNFDSTDDSLFQMSAFSNNIPEEAIPNLRKTIRQKARGWLKEASATICGHDRDLNPSAEGTGRKYMALGMYYYVNDFEPEEVHA